MRNVVFQSHFQRVWVQEKKYVGMEVREGFLVEPFFAFHIEDEP